MKRNEYWDVHEELSGTTSTVVRALILPGVAIVWLFHYDAGTSIVVPQLGLYALFAFTIAVLCDVLQYVYSARLYYHLARQAEIRGKEPSGHNPRLDAPTYGFYYGKIFLTIAGYVCIASYLWGRLSIAV